MSTAEMPTRKLSTQERRLAKGICIRCGSKPSVAGITMCEKCRDRKRKESSDRYDKAVELGRCTICFKNPSAPKRRVCKTCYNTRNRGYDKFPEPIRPSDGSEVKETSTVGMSVQQMSATQNQVDLELDRRSRHTNKLVLDDDAHARYLGVQFMQMLRTSRFIMQSAAYLSGELTVEAIEAQRLADAEEAERNDD